MRKWILAAVAALAVGQAEARTYTLTFIADQVPDPDYFGPDYPAPTIVLDLPSFRNVSIGQTYEDSMYGWDGVYFPPVISLPRDPSGITKTGFHLTTNDLGKITDLGVMWSDLLEEESFELSHWSIWYYPNSELLFSSTGHWDVSPVPLPATAPMLLGAVGLLGWIRGRGSRRGQPTSAG